MYNYTSCNNFVIVVTTKNHVRLNLLIPAIPSLFFKINELNLCFHCLPDVCPEPPSPDTDVPTFFVNGQMTDPVNLLENITSSVGGPEKFLNMFKETILKGN